MPAAGDPAATLGASAKGPHVSNDPPLFNTTVRKLDEPQVPRRPAAALARMRAHWQVERMMREDKINDNLRAVWVQAVTEFKESR